MEEKSWIWTINVLSQGSLNSIHCINILPVLILKAGSPFKLIYTDENGKLCTILTPCQQSVQKTFQSCLHPVQDPELKLFNYNGTTSNTKLSKLSENLSDSIIAIQGIKEKAEVLKHKVEFINQFYSSACFYYKVSAWVPINNISLEKYLIVCSINSISLIEKSQNMNLNKLETIFIKDKLGKIWIQTFLPCQVLKLNIPRSSILSHKILVSSTINEKVAKLNKTQTLERHSFLPSRLKPKVGIEKRKISQFLQKSFSRQKLPNTEKFCFGTYCNLDIQVDIIKKHRKVEAGSFYSLNHQIIRRSLQQVEFPIQAKNFIQVFYQVLKLNYSEKLRKSFHKTENDFIVLCPVCYIILQVCNEII